MAELLLVEDDSSLGETLRERLEKEGHHVVWAQSLSDAEAALNSRNFSLLLLDVGLPDGNGFDFARQLRRRSAVPLVFLTAMATAEYRLHGYEIGAEEYIPKPFHLQELLLRVRHVLENHSPPSVLQVGEAELNLEQMTVQRNDGATERLPKRDFAVLRLLLEQAPNIVSRDMILDRVWGAGRYPSNRTVDNTIMRIRSALGDAEGRLIRTVRGVGYQYAVQEEDNGK